ncbi:glycyl-radical enzyme activating protein family [Denitrovibrio acetiphilus DSM 12809]|uniref:Glycyl-radical enzyme activating protein family n=1 Tax=Denitrovibrio acetiphilus (strain DSM 12809 / NBRC 114555 / N2460) TaxID=522772 RepID=D4H8D5_DENA2|nr:glycyl-radical enzyme activating protein [Denitrovibrio acetiphilus]ADD68284.1 glycyl-radical enzyme activating protein family [Denitrovibrio acetiphilus DSM 12809]
MCVNKGIIFDIKHYAVHDGPGIRTTVFFKGCPLSCMWCHNPESRMQAPQTITKELKLDNTTRTTKETVGKEMTVSEVMTEINKDIIFFEESGGGVTFSGGEVFQQDKFLISLLAECKKSDINICVDTTGHVSTKVLKTAAPLVDTFLYDIKLMNDDAHKKYCGVSNKLILANLRFLLESGADVRVRFPVIPGITDTEENLIQIADFLSEYKQIKIDLLAYHKIGRDKYRRLGMEYHMAGVQQPSAKRMQQIADFFTSKDFIVKIGG